MKKKTTIIKPPRLIIWGSKPCWVSSRALKENIKLRFPEIRVLLVGKNNTKFKPRPTDVYINYGNSGQPSWNYFNLPLNRPALVGTAIHKGLTFHELDKEKVPTVPWTILKEEATKWQQEGQDVVVRHKPDSSGGDGIELISPDQVLPTAPLYTQYKKKKYEYRIHVFKDDVIDATWKRKKIGAENINTKIRNFENGWVYCREDFMPSETLCTIAREAVKALGLDFGAVDIIYNEYENKYYVLEVNTAPGLEGTTLESYTYAIVKEFIHD